MIIIIVIGQIFEVVVFNALHNFSLFSANIVIVCQLKVVLRKCIYCHWVNVT